MTAAEPWRMFLGAVIGASAAIAVARGASNGDLADLLLDDGGPWWTVALVGVTLTVLALGAPRVGRTLGPCLAAAFLYAAVDPTSTDPERLLLPLLTLAVLSAASALLGHTAARRVPEPDRQVRSSRQLREALRAAERRAAAR